MNLPLGYAYSAVYAGIRQAERDDLALIVTGLDASAAAVFTRNRVQAAPVRLCRRHLALSKGRVGAILMNAGNANCATRTGDAVALSTARATAKILKLPVAQVLTASTGVIGVEMDGAKITGALPRLVEGLSPARFEDAALRESGAGFLDYLENADDKDVQNRIVGEVWDIMRQLKARGLLARLLPLFASGNPTVRREAATACLRTAEAQAIGVLEGVARIWGSREGFEAGLALARWRKDGSIVYGV